MPSKILKCILTIVFLAALIPVANAARVFEIPLTAMQALHGLDAEKIRVYSALAGGPLQTIPFQIEEKAVDGKLGPGNGKLEAGETLLLVETDAGRRVDPSQWPKSRPLLEVGLDGAGTRTVYVAYEETPSAKSTKSHVRYDSQLDEVTTEAYQIAFSKGAPLIQDKLIIKRRSGGKDILDRFKIRLKLAIKNFFDFKIHEGEISSQRTAYRDGPIRVTRRLVAYKKLGPIGLIPRSSVDFYFYPEWVVIPSRFNNPVDGPKFLETSTSGLSGYDFSKDVYGSALFSNLSPASERLDGVASSASQPEGIFRWWALAGDQGAMVVGVKNDPQLAKLSIYPNLRVIDDAGQSSAPESDPGQTFIGYDLPYHRIPKGDYLLEARLVFPEDFVTGTEEGILSAAQEASPHFVRELP